MTIPDGVTSIGNSAFSGCSGLNNVYISDLSTWCGIKFGNSSSNPLSCKANLYLNGVIVEDLTIPDGVSTIGSYAFYGCTSLTSVTVPGSVASINNSAFYACTNLIPVYFEGNAPTVYSASFNATITLLYIPSATGWTDSSAYNASVGTWNGYKLVVWKERCVHNWSATTCTEFESCSFCGASNAEMLIHTPTSAVKEATTDISYDEVVYCSVCSRVISRKTHVVKYEVPILADQFIGEIQQKDIAPDGYIPIYTVADLKNIENAWYKNYILMADLDLAGVQWEPIGTEEQPFSGVFDGNGHTIHNLEIQQLSQADYVGFFGYCTGTIKNLNLKGGSVASTVACDYLGSIAGFADTIENCTSSCAVVAVCKYGGGIAGEANTVRQCLYFGVLSCRYEWDNAQTGKDGGNFSGICGTAKNVYQCLNYGYICANSFYGHFNSYKYTSIGGIIGEAGSSCTIRQCTNYGHIENNSKIYGGDAHVGGIIGWVRSSASVYDCSNHGALTANNTLYVGIVGGIVGYSVGYPSLVRCFNKGTLENKSEYRYDWYIGAVCGLQHTSGGYYYRCFRDKYGIAGNGNANSYIDLAYECDVLTSEEFCQQDSFTRNPAEITDNDRLNEYKAVYDFETVWELDDGMAHPQLRAFHHLFPKTISWDDIEYENFGHLDNYDRTGFITIDGVKYTMTEAFQTSSANIGPIGPEINLSEYLYVAYNLDENNQITAAKIVAGTLCTLEEWDAENKIVRTDLNVLIEVGEGKYSIGKFTVSDAAITFPYDKMDALVGTKILVYVVGPHAFHVIPVTTGEGLVTAYDDKSDPCTVTIDGKVYPLAKYSSLLETIKAPFVNSSKYTKDAAFVLYDGVLVELEYTNAKLDPTSFNEYIYRAEIALDPHDEWHAGVQDLYLRGDTPSKTTVEICKDSGFATLANTWTGVTTVFDSLVDSPSVGVKKVTLTQIDLYTAILLDSLECSFKSDIVSEAKKNTEDVRTEMGLVTGFIKEMRGYETTANINMNDIYGTLTKAEKENIASFVAADFRSSYGNIDMPADLISYLGTGFEIADTFESWLEEAVSYYKVLLLSQEMHEVIQTLYDECPAENWWMKQALENCITVIDAGLEDFNTVMEQRAAIAAGEFAAIQITDFLWGKVSEGVEKIFPQVALVKAIYKAGKLLANELFNSDAKTEAYYKLLALNNFQDLGRSVMDDYAAEFDRLGTAEAAKIYLESAKLCWQIYIIGTQYTVDFYTAMKDGATSDIEEWISGADLEDIIATYERGKNFAEVRKEQFEAAWIENLQADYPELYPYYKNRLNEAIELNKLLHVACPVDVSVYDENDVLVAYVKDGRPYASGNITAVVVGEEKYFYFYDDEDYKIVCDGYNEGTMDVFVTEYDNNAVSRQVNYLDVPVSSESTHDLDGSTYILSASAAQIQPDYDTSCTETKYTVRINNGFATTDNTFEYEFEAAAGQIIDINTHLPEGYRFEGWTCDNSAVEFDDPMSMDTSFVMIDDDIVINAAMTAPLYSVIVDAGTGGSVSGTVTVSAGSEITVTATPDRGYGFAHWIENGEIVSTDANYTFVAYSDRELTAVFETLPYIVEVTDTSENSVAVKLTNNTVSTSVVQFVLAAYNAEGKMIVCTYNQKELCFEEVLSQMVEWDPDSIVAEIRGFVLDSVTKKPISPMWTYAIPS